MVVAVLVVLQVIIWKETNGNWNKLYEFCEHKSSGSYTHCSYVFILNMHVCGLPDIVYVCRTHFFVVEPCDCYVPSPAVNSIQWAPHEWGLILACGSSDESFSIISTSG